MDAALAQFEGLVQDAIDAVPACRGSSLLRALVRAEAERLVPPSMRQSPALRAVA
jgi:geranylgeranyl diphosphate synthase type II